MNPLLGHSALRTARPNTPLGQGGACTQVLRAVGTAILQSCGGKHHKAMNSPSVRRQIVSPDRLGRFSTASSDNAPKTPSKLTREELCGQVWESPSVACVTIPVSEVMTLTLQNRVEDDSCRCRSRLKVAGFRSFVARTSRFLAGIRVGSDFWLRSLELSQVI